MIPFIKTTYNNGVVSGTTNITKVDFTYPTLENCEVFVGNHRYPETQYVTDEYCY